MCSKIIVGIHICHKTPPYSTTSEDLCDCVIRTGNKAAEIPVSDGVQDTDPKYSDTEVVDDLDPKYSEAAMFQLDGDSDHSKEPPWKSVGKYGHSKTRKDGEEVI